MILYERYEACNYGLEGYLFLFNFQAVRYTPLNHDIFLLFNFNRSFFLSCMFFWYICRKSFKYLFLFAISITFFPFNFIALLKVVYSVVFEIFIFLH